MSLEHNTEESSMNNTNYGIYFEKSQIRNVPKLPNCSLSVLSHSALETAFNFGFSN
jgi:hypothetical protein